MALCKRSPSVANDESLAVFLRYLPATIPDPDPSRDGLDNSLAIPIIVGGRLLTTVTLVDEFSSDEEGMPGWWLSPMISVLNSLDKDCSAAPQGTIYWGQFVGLLLVCELVGLLGRDLRLLPSRPVGTSGSPKTQSMHGRAKPSGLPMHLSRCGVCGLGRTYSSTVR